MLVAVLHVVPTPNPDARKIVLGSRLVSRGTYSFGRGDDLGNSPLAESLLGVDGVDRILIARDFVTIERAPEADWESVEAQVAQRLAVFTQTYQMAVIDEDASAPASPSSEVEMRILQILEDDIRPAVATDGGDIEYVGFEDGVVLVRLSGACGSCPSSTATLKNGIERLLREELPEVMEVRAVD